MTEKNQLSGLCINCSNAEKCNYCMNHKRPVIFCEEFSCLDPLESKTDIDKDTQKFDYPIKPVWNGICNCNKYCKNGETRCLKKTDDHVINFKKDK
ncbi:MULTISPECIES: hypothetical protein [Desulfobacula]|uniref:Uncharacterized protein n=2 Tax=Desulfobacula TaxID=28222 RepID=K0NKS8_DESTT|nr:MULTISPECIES: hypothetical protein [Desulfobacula]CCK80533.1 uncharacterized protein TOL2_C23720 [Desulfobacula toluolica Tol2]SDT96078.1 hypothetical protein SAMN04487931_103214 [Desulfobacula phenolica]